MAMPNLLEPIIEFKQMCSGNQKNGPSVMEGLLNQFQITSRSVHRSIKGKRAGIFYHQKIFNDGNEMHMAGEYVEENLRSLVIQITNEPTNYRIQKPSKKIRWKSNDTNHYFSGYV